MRSFILIFFCFAFLRPSQADSQSPYRLSLQEAIQKANVINLQVMMANARLEQAIARIYQARSELLPHIDGEVSGARQTADLRAEGLNIPIPGFETRVGPYNNFDARPRITIDLFDPSAFERFQAAKKGVDLSQAQLEKTREDVIALVASFYIDAQRKQQSVLFLKTLLDKDQMAYQLSTEEYAEGTGTLLDLNQYKSDLSQTQYLYAQAKVQETDARWDLEAALQLPLDSAVEFIDDKNFVAKMEKQAAINFNNATNADMGVASSQLDSSRAQQKAVYADFLPKVSGMADYGRSGASPDHSSNTYAVGLKASIPIWDGGDQQANLKEAKDKVKEAEEDLLDVTEQTQVNIAKARAAIIEAHGLKQAKFQQLHTAQRAMLIAFHAQQLGSGTVLQVMQAKADLAIAEDQNNEAQANWVMSHIDLLHAQGRLRELAKKS